VAAIMASYVMYGFDTAGALAEETVAPRQKVPWAILQALASAALLGGLLIACGLMAAPDLHAPQVSELSGGLPFIVTQTLGPGLGTVFLCIVIFAIFVCTLAVQSGAVRLIFAMARDNNLPFSVALARVSRTSRTPIVPALVSGVLALLILVVNVDAPKLIVSIGSVAIVWANLAYLLVTVPLLVRRLRGWPPPNDRVGTLSLGRWGLPVNCLAVVWGVLTVVNVGWPRTAVYGDEWYEQYAAVLFTGGLLLVGGGYYALVQRHKTGVLPEHRSEGETKARFPLD
jgi:amino acid transporter